MRASRNANPGRASALGTLVAVIAAGALLGGASVGGFRALTPAIAEAADPAPKPAAAKPAAKPSAPAPAPAAAQKAPATAKPVTAKTATTRPSAVRPAPPRGPATASPAPTAAKPSLVQPLTQLDDHITYQYNTLGRRDPFNPLLGGEFVGQDLGGNAPVETGGMTVVGIVWGAEDKFALVEDARGNSVILREGDKVMNGHVEALKRDAVIVSLSMDGQEQSVAIPLTKKGDSNANR
jgi:hypothetical protein